MRARIAGGAALVVILAAYGYCLVNLLPLSACITTCVAGAFAVLIGASAANGHGFSSALSNRWMVMGGEASYSLYLLHYWVMHDLGHRLADNRPVLIRSGVFVVLMLVSVGIARVSYLIYERPMIRIVRRMFSVRPLTKRYDEALCVGSKVETRPTVVPLKECVTGPNATLTRCHPDGAPQ
jgi:peptidoglycan/LPS O-acetylase OafA/YrhL